MASLSGVSGSNMTSSLYNSANVISGLASGLDTEGMIENLVKSYQAKINQLNQKVTKTEWKQDAYRSIISKMVGFGSKYASYSSTTNLLSPNFFSSAVKVATQGLYGDRVTASGKSSSDISLNAVKQLATSAQFRTKSNLKTGQDNVIEASEGLDIKSKTSLGTLNGSMTIAYGSNNISISFDEVADKKALDEIKASFAADPKNTGKVMSEAEALAQLINKKLEDQKISFSGGTSDDAVNRIEVKAKGNSITFKDKSSGGNSVYISKASGNVEEALGLDLENAKETQPSVVKLGNDFKATKEVNNTEYLSGKTMNLSLDGKTKSIALPQLFKSGDVYQIWDPQKGDRVTYSPDEYARILNQSLENTFGKGKITASNVGSDGELKLQLKVQEGSNLVVNTDVGEALGIGRTATSYLNTNKTLGELLGEDKLAGMRVATENGKPIKDSKGNPTYAFVLNGVTVGNYSKDSTLADILADINSNKDAGVKVSYSQTTKNFLFTTRETGEDSGIAPSSELSWAMFGHDASTSQKTADYLGDMLPDGKLAGKKIQFTVGEGSDAVEVDFTFKKDDSTLEGMLNQVNKQLESKGMKASIEPNGELVVKKGDERVEYKTGEEDDIATLLNKRKVEYTLGKNAEFNITVNGETFNMSRSSNSVEIDGLTINFQDTFDGAVDKDGKPTVDTAGNVKNAVTFKSTTDSDKIVDAIKSMIEDYNAMMTEIKAAYSTMPYQKSNGSFADYEPLTDEDREGMSESAIERYEEKAKQGILFGDRTLSGLYDKLRNVFSPAGEDGAYLRAMGINVNFSITEGTQTVTLDESKLRAMLDSDPDIVADVFTRTSGTGGVMQNLKNQVDNYARTTGEPKGILIQQAGSPLSSLSLMNNTWQKQIENLNTQIQKWQDKLSSQVDRYTQQFSRLEQIIQQMNSQSASLAGLMGG
ncbi:MAG: flagellar filament capping protein FliD [Lawsonibacter sp.]|nr:flagellar filament capping protein FliD [Lawsonibacter sp.]